MKGKYVILEMEKFGETPFAFPNYIGRDEFVKQMKLKRKDVVSAGFFTTTKDGLFKAYGESVSLNVKSRSIDSFTLTKDLLDTVDVNLI